MKKLILFMLIVMIIPIVYGEICGDTLTPGNSCTMFTPPINCTAYNYTIYNEAGFIETNNLTLFNDSIYYFDFDLDKGDYIIVLCDDSYREISVAGDDNMSSIAIVMFILTVTIALVIIPFYIRFTKHWFANLILRRACWVIAIYLMVLNSAIMASIAEFSGIDLTREMFIYMWMFGVLGYVLMGVMVLKTLYDAIAMFNAEKQKKRMGEDGEEQ